MFTFNEIGIVKSKFSEKADPFKMREEESIIEIKKEYEAGLYRLNDSDYLEVFFYFHQSSGYDLKTTNYFGEYKGVFATRSPRRPSNLGASIVRLLKQEQNRLYVKGLDAIDGTLVIDLKPYNSGYLSETAEDSGYASLKDNPRGKMIQLIKNNKMETLLTLSGVLHGHYCPGLSMGVIGAVYAVNQLNAFSDGMEGVLAVAEINSCFTDAVQLITGCSVGNNSLIYRDLGKTAFSLVKRDGAGIRLSVLPSFREKQREENPEFSHYFNKVVIEKNRDPDVLSQFKKLSKEASFRMLVWDITDIFKIETVKLVLPDYAPIRDTVYCALCGDGIMKGKETQQNGLILCRHCADSEFYQLDGTGISCLKKHIND